MAFFPKVQSPCPYKADLAAIMDGDMCRMCKRQVVDISDWSDDARRDLIAGCRDEVCVSYRIVRPALAAAALAAAAIPSAALAQEQAAAPAAETIAPLTPTEVAQTNVPEQDYVIVGGINDPANAEFMSAEELAAIPEVPVTYEDDQAAPPPAADPGR
jgi:predicted Fe-S protein YdhL (DUF1289 family)